VVLVQDTEAGARLQGLPGVEAQQKILWAEVRKETGRGKGRFTIRHLLADTRCSQSVLDFLTTTDVGGQVPAEEDARSEVSEWEFRERRERKEPDFQEQSAVGAVGASGQP